MKKGEAMKHDKEFNETLKKIGIVAGVGEDWFTIGDAEKSEDGETVYGVYAKTDAIAEKVEAVFDRLIAERENE